MPLLVIPPTAGFELVVTLLHVKPAVFRTLLVPESLTLAELHRAIQAAFGWENSHLHEFIVGRRRFAEKAPPGESWGGPAPADERKVVLAELGLRPGQKFQYLYDFGDGWEHSLRVKRQLARAPSRPVCVDGEGACPPEDSGGPPGYEALLAALAAPTRAEHRELVDWAEGLDVDPHACDLAEINRRMLARRSPRDQLG